MDSDLISRKALLERLEKIYGTDSIVDKIMLRFLKKLIRKQPTVDAVEVVHARWENGRCTNCGHHAEIRNFGFTCTGRPKANYITSNYCPNCGADMRGKKNVSD